MNPGGLRWRRKKVCAFSVRWSVCCSNHVRFCEESEEESEEEDVKPKVAGEASEEEVRKAMLAAFYLIDDTFQSSEYESDSEEEEKVEFRPVFVPK